MNAFRFPSAANRQVADEEKIKIMVGVLCLDYGLASCTLHPDSPKAVSPELKTLPGCRFRMQHAVDGFRLSQGF